MIFDQAMLARLRDLQFEIETLHRACARWTIDSRPANEEEGEMYLNSHDALRDSTRERDQIVADALRAWPGWRTYAQIKAEREAARAR